MQYTRGSRHDFYDWAKAGCTGWGYEDVLPYFLKSEDMLMNELKNSEYHNTGGNMAVSSGGNLDITDKWLQAGKELIYNVVDYNVKTMEGFSPIQLNVKHGVRSSSSLEYLGKHFFLIKGTIYI